MRHGDVNLLGFGRSAGMIPWGTLAVSAVGTTASIAARALGYGKYSEGIGLLAGVGVGAGLWASGRSDSGKLAIAVTLSNNGLRFLEQMLLSSAPTLGWASYETANPMLGMPSAQQIAGPMGYAMATNQPHAYGTVPGVAGAVAGPMRDTGHPPVMQSNGPGMASLFGATLY